VGAQLCPHFFDLQKHCIQNYFQILSAKCRPQITACCEFDGNRHRVETNRLDLAAELRCSHFRGDEVGDLFFTRL
jgi:hypothetical protein